MIVKVMKKFTYHTGKSSSIPGYKAGVNSQQLLLKN